MRIKIYKALLLIIMGYIFAMSIYYRGTVKTGFNYDFHFNEHNFAFIINSIACTIAYIGYKIILLHKLKRNKINREEANLLNEVMILIPVFISIIGTSILIYLRGNLVYALLCIGILAIAIIIPKVTKLNENIKKLTTQL